MIYLDNAITISIRLSNSIGHVNNLIKQKKGASKKISPAHSVGLIHMKKETEMKGMHWWCYIGYEDLFKKVYHRPTTAEERGQFKQMTTEQRNSWILQHIGLTNGIFCAMDQRAENGYIAFTTLPYFCKGISDGEITIPEGITEFVIPHPGTTKWGFSVERRGNTYKIVSWWNNDSVDRGQTTLEMNQNGELGNFRMESAKLKCPIKYNWGAKQWEPST